MPKNRFYGYLLVSLSIHIPVFAEVEHRGFVGGPFHGTIQDEKRAVTVQVGPSADLIVPNGLIAHTEQNQVPSGGLTSIHASVLLDDGTYTVLDPSVVDWSFSQPGLSVENGSLLTELFPKRTMVRVQASAEGFSTNFTVFILADDGQVAQEQSESLPETLRSAIELEAKGWKESEWFGVFYNAKNGWLYHAAHGWIHVAEGGPDATWFWNEQNQWVWTGKNIYPHLYRDRDAAWLYFFKQALPEKVFYNHKTQEFERFAEK
ncbi:MAG: hypothetical protein VW907_05660 [Opitutae bacterium]